MATELTTESYIGHHLTNLTCGKTPDGWTCDPYMVDKMGFGPFMLIRFFGLYCWEPYLLLFLGWVFPNQQIQHQPGYRI